MVNTTTEGTQEWPAMARLKDGGHVVAWLSNRGPLVPFPGPATDRSICTQRYGVDGAAAGAETCIGSSDPNLTHGPAVTALADGGYVVAWATIGDVTLASSLILTQRYDANGTAVGGVQQSNENAGVVADEVNAAPSASGGFVLSWTREIQNGPPVGGTALMVVARRFGADGLPTGPEQTISTGSGSLVAMAALNGAGYVILRSDAPPVIGSNAFLLATRYDDQLAQLGPEIRVADDTRSQAITSLADGGFAIGWLDVASGEVRVQRFARDGSLVGAPVPVDSPVPILRCIGRTGPPGVPCPAAQFGVDLAGLDDGGYVATWAADLSAPSDSNTGFKVFARRFAADGTAAGPVIAVSETSITGVPASQPSITALPGASVAISWSGTRVRVGSGVSTLGTEDIFERRLDAQSLGTGAIP